MSQKLRASRLERVFHEIEQKAFISWRDTRSLEEHHMLFFELCTRLARLGYIAPPPVSLWSLPEAEKAAYLQSVTDLDTSEHWHSAALVVRELWLEAIGALQPAEVVKE
jgi:hypothetical protein